MIDVLNNVTYLPSPNRDRRNYGGNDKTDLFTLYAKSLPVDEQKDFEDGNDYFKYCLKTDSGVTFSY